MNEGTILAAAGDVGGAMALIPVLAEIERRGQPFFILDHGILSQRAPSAWSRLIPEQRARCVVDWGKMEAQAYLFATSVKDHVPLAVARDARKCSIPIVCVLDNWMNYRRRLEIDGKGLFLPDVYAVMDELARKEAIADGVPASVLRVTGHPGLASLGHVYSSFSHYQARNTALSRLTDRQTISRLIVFVSEPVATDQGSSPGAPRYRGYTQYSVLEAFARALQPHADSVAIGLAPHPREDGAMLAAHWERCRGRLEGGLMDAPNGREAVLVSDAVCGMSSLLLYEAMLLGKPTISLQPGLRTSHLCFLREKGLRDFVTEKCHIGDVVSTWVEDVLRKQGTPRFHSEMALHTNAPSRVARLLGKVAG